MSVCKIDYIGEKYSEKDATYVASIHEDVENTLREMGSGLIKRGANKAPHFRPQNYRTDTYVKINSVVNNINKMYGGKVVFLLKDASGRNYLKVNVNNISDKRLFFHKDAINKSINDPYRVTDDGEVVNVADYDYEKRVSGVSTMDDSTLQSIINQAKEFENKFKAAGVSTIVIIDGDLGGSGAVLSESNPKRKALIEDGSITKDGFVIAINPNKITSDTVSHEFGHIFLDLIGGVDNARVKVAFNKLKGTPIYNQVKSLYPELSESSPAFIKEVVTSALGENTDNVFKRKDDKNWWEKFKDWFYDKIGIKFNIKKDAIQSLTEDLINIQNQNFKNINVNKDQYNQKNSAKLSDVYKKTQMSIDSIDQANKIIYQDIKKLISQYEYKNGKLVVPTDLEIAQVGDRNMTERSRLGLMKSLGNSFDEIVKGEEEKFLIEFAQQIHETSISQIGWLEKKNNLFNDDPNYEYNPKNMLKILSKIREYSVLFSVANDIYKDINNLGLRGERKEQVIEALSNAISNQKRLNSLYLDVSRRIIVDTQHSNFDLIRTEYKNNFIKEYNQTKDSSETRVINNEKKDDFVDRMMAESSDEITKKTKDYLNNQLRESVDIGGNELWVRDEKSINSTSITLTSRMFDQADLNKNKAFIPFRRKGYKTFQDFSKAFSNMNPEKMYESFIDDTHSKNTFLVSQYKAEFYEKFEEYSIKLRELSNNVNKIDPSVDQKAWDDNIKKLNEVRDEFTKWKKDNSTVERSDKKYTRIPNDKYINPKYNEILSDPKKKAMYEFLLEINEEANEATRGLKSLNKTLKGVDATWHIVPIVGKDSLEKVADGELKANLRDTVERLYKYQEDELEIGQEAVTEESIEKEANDEHNKNYFKKTLRAVKGSFDGTERQLVPIFFREGLDKKRQSKDLMSAYMLNLYMSMNFKEKSLIQADIQVLMDVNEAKRIKETEGLKTILKVSYMSAEDMRGIEKKDTSNEYNKLKSMVENRMYGVKTIQSEYGKIAESIMGWTGTTMLALNFYSGMANLIQGKTMNFIESVGGEFYNRKDLIKGESKFFGDMGSWIDDIGSLENESRTMMLLDLLDPQGDFNGIKDRYVRNTKTKSLTSRSSLSFPNKMGEYYIQGSLMYTIMNNVKVRDINGNYLDKDFRPTKDKEKAISIDDAILFKEDGTSEIDSRVHDTTFSYTANGDRNKILLETKNLVKKVTADLHGQYDDNTSAHMQRTFYGKAFLMLRKWLQPGIDRRYRGMVYAWDGIDESIDDADMRHTKFYSQDTKSFREGSHTTFVKFTRQLYKEGMLFNMNLAGQTKVWNKLSDHEKANIRRFTTEFAIIALTIVSAWLLKGLASELPEDEAKAAYLSAFLFRRLHQELIAYVNPLEALQLMKSPAASISMIEKSTQLISQTLYDGFNVIGGDGLEEYQSGKRKGDLKIAKRFKDVIPVFSQTNRNLEDVVEYVFARY